MKIYNNYTSQEKSDYNMCLYVTNLYKRLDLVYNDADTKAIIDVLNIIKKKSGSKRLKVKDAIILTCISYFTGIDSLKLASSLDIENRYIYNSRKLFVESPELKEFIKTKTAFQQVTQLYNENRTMFGDNCSIDNLAHTEKLIEYCQSRHILSESNLLTIGVSCLYFVLLTCQEYYTRGIQIDLVKFSKIFNVSHITISKSIDRIKMYIKEQPEM